MYMHMYATLINIPALLYIHLFSKIISSQRRETDNYLCQSYPTFFMY